MIAKLGQRRCQRIELIRESCPSSELISYHGKPGRARIEQRVDLRLNLLMINTSISSAR